MLLRPRCVYTENDFPAQWADSGEQSRHIPLPLTGDRGENLQKTIRCYQAAIRIRTEEHFPRHGRKPALTSGSLISNWPALTGDSLQQAMAVQSFIDAETGLPDGKYR